METKEFEFNGSVVEFEIKDKNVMVNATQMAKVYDKQVVAFLRNDDTKRFIEECLKSENSHFLNVKNEEELVVSRQKSGTFMHRILALKFAAWLNPKFELWVYSTIDDLLFGSYKEDEDSMKEIARIQAKITAKEKAMEEDPRRKEIEDLKKAEAKVKRTLEFRKKIRISNFRTMFSEEEMNGEKKE